MLDPQNYLDPDETILARSKKRPYALILQILFNRGCPAIAVIPLLVYAMINPVAVLDLFRNEPKWLVLLFSAVVAVGASVNVYMALEYFRSSLLLTSKRIIRIKGNKHLPAEFADVLKVEVKGRFLSSRILINLSDTETIDIDYLEYNNALTLEKTIKEFCSTNSEFCSA
ncbi:hypothetical protein [Geothrix limicola]|uniref:hypothetical protein n=1 Tax=Geothrix limicola TaxID=2927978 RepID=UPI002552C22D|nr:hypothetical protein [Geothrix limicola]